MDFPSTITRPLGPPRLPRPAFERWSSFFVEKQPSVHPNARSAAQRDQLHAGLAGAATAGGLLGLDSTPSLARQPSIASKAQTTHVTPPSRPLADVDAAVDEPRTAAPHSLPTHSALRPLQCPNCSTLVKSVCFDVSPCYGPCCVARACSFASLGPPRPDPPMRPHSPSPPHTLLPPHRGLMVSADTLLRVLLAVV